MRAALPGRLLAVLLTGALVAVAGSGGRFTPSVVAPVLARTVDEAAPPQGNRPDRTVLRSRTVSVTLAGLPDATSADQRPDSQPVVRLDLFDDVSIVAVFERFDPNPAGTTWVGHVAGIDHSNVTLVYGDGRLTGSVMAPDATYTIRPAPDGPGATGLHIVAEIDQAGFRPEGPMVDIVLPEVAADGLGTEVQADSADLIDVLVVYTPAAVAWAGSTASLESQIALAISQTNTSYANSGVLHRLRLMHTAQVPYTEAASIDTDLSNVRSGAGGLSGVAALRDAYGADVVALVRYDASSPYCGIGYLMTNPSVSFAGWAFTVTEADCLSNQTLAHEVGHNMGLRHDWYMDSATSPYSHAHGHVNTAAGNRWRTIMSYNNLCSAQQFNCQRILYWSNPTLTYNGAPLGITSGTKSTCTTGSLTANTCDADERLTLNNTAPIVANFRQAIVAPAAFGKTAPANGATNQPGSMTLTWQTAAGATSYAWCLDTSQNGVCDGAWTSAGNAVSAAVSGLAAGATYEWQVRATNATGTTFANSGPWTFGVGPAPGANLVSNGTFGAGTTSWQQFASPTPNDIVSNVTSGVLQFYRVVPPAGGTNQAVVFQQTGMPVAANAPVRVAFDLGNSDPVRKRVSVLVHDSDFSDLAVCTFWLPASTSLTTYTMRTHTTRAWSNATVSFYAATAGTSGGYYRIDNVTLQYEPTQPATRTDCVDPFAPSPSAQVDGPDLIGNGAFSTGTLAPWTTFGTLTQRVSGGVFEFVRPTAANPAGVILQSTGQPQPAGALLTATFALGNSSSVRKRVTAILHDADFSDLSACTFWLEPGQPLTSYAHGTYTTEAWSNATLSIYPSTVGADEWIRLDTVTLRRTPSAAIVGTECLGPGAVADMTPDTSPDSAIAMGDTSWTASDDDPRREAQNDVNLSPAIVDGWIAEGFLWTGDGWTTTDEETAPVRTLTSASPLDLSGASEAVLTFGSTLTAVGARATVEVRVNGMDWETVAVVDPSDTWWPTEVDLTRYAGLPVDVRFVYRADGAASPDLSGQWAIEGVLVAAR
jgi:hypothetical protein